MPSPGTAKQTRRNLTAEHREIIIGQSVLRRLMAVCFTERFKNIVRIYSARPTTRHEQNDYQENAGSETS
jgi:uncharacterized DUF497 family protein